MASKNDSNPGATGGCLCDSVRYEIHGPLRNVVSCHCSKCRRFSGNIGAYTSIMRDNLIIKDKRTLKWYRSVKDETPDVYRGFCSECGSSLFWDPRQKDTIAVAAGSLDEPTGLTIAGHVWTDQMGDYYEITDDAKQFPKGWE